MMIIIITSLRFGYLRVPKNYEMRFLLLIVTFLITSINTLTAQNVTYEIDGLRLFIDETGDCFSGPDPRWRARATTQYTGNVDWNVSEDDVSGGGWQNFSNLNWVNNVTVPNDAIISISLDAWEEDPAQCDNPCFSAPMVGQMMGIVSGIKRLVVFQLHQGHHVNGILFKDFVIVPMMVRLFVGV